MLSLLDRALEMVHYATANYEMFFLDIQILFVVIGGKAKIWGILGASDQCILNDENRRDRLQRLGNGGHLKPPWPTTERPKRSGEYSSK